MEELLQILNKLEENTNIILEENKKLENEIKILKGENVDIQDPIPEYNYDGGLLGDLREATYEAGNNIKHSFEEGKLILEGNNRYANLAIIYREKEEDCIPNVLGQYVLHIEGYKEKRVKTLTEVVDYLNGVINIEPNRVDVKTYFEQNNKYTIDFSEVKGQENIKRALEVSAAGGHNCLLIRKPRFSAKL